MDRDHTFRSDTKNATALILQHKEIPGVIERKKGWSGGKDRAGQQHKKKLQE
jgi:hypothetical protein